MPSISAVSAEPTTSSFSVNSRKSVAQSWRACQLVERFGGVHGYTDRMPEVSPSTSTADRSRGDYGMANVRAFTRAQYCSGSASTHEVMAPHSSENALVTVFPRRSRMCVSWSG